MLTALCCFIGFVILFVWILTHYLYTQSRDDDDVPPTSPQPPRPKSPSLARRPASRGITKVHRKKIEPTTIPAYVHTAGFGTIRATPEPRTVYVREPSRDDQNEFVNGMIAGALADEVIRDIGSVFQSANADDSDPFSGGGGGLSGGGGASGSWDSDSGSSSSSD